MGALRTMIGKLENSVRGDEVLRRQVPLLHLTIAEIPLNAGPTIRNHQVGVGQRAIHSEERSWIPRIGRPDRQVVRSSIRILESIRTVAHYDLRRIKDSIRRTKREAIAAAYSPRKSDPGREILVI